MSKKLESSNAIEQAMADALAAVERVEQKAKPPKSSDAVANSAPPKGGPTPKSSANQKHGDVPPAAAASSKVHVIPVEVEPEPKPPTAAPAAEIDVVPRDQLLRLAADFENYRKRASRELDDTRKYGIEKLLKDLLPMLDNLDRALAHAEDDKNPVIEGVRMVAKQAHEILTGYGVRAFTSVGEPFDPERHEAVAQVPSNEHPAGSVVEEMLKGYVIHERLLRPAQVVVAAPRAATFESPSNSPTTPTEGGTGSAS